MGNSRGMGLGMTPRQKIENLIGFPRLRVH